MRRCWRPLLLVILWLPLARTGHAQAPTPTPTPTPLYCHAQVLFTTSDSTCTGSPTVTFPVLTTENTGDALVVETSQGGFFGGPAAITSVTDTGGNTYSCQTQLNSGQIRSSVCWTVIGASGADTVTVTENCTGASSGNLVGDLEEYYTNGGTVSLDLTAGNTGHSVTPDSGTTGTTGQATELAAAALAIGCLAGSPTPNCTISGPTNSFLSLGVIGENGSGIVNSSLQPTYKLLSATGTQDTSATVSSFTPQWAGNILTLKNINAICVPPTPTPTNSPTPTQTPTPTMTPTPTPTPAPTATPATSAVGIEALLRPCTIPLSRANSCPPPYMGPGPVPSATATVCPAQWLYVNGINGSDSNNGTTETTPFKTIQHSVDQAQTCGNVTVFVETGVPSGSIYPEMVTIHTPGTRPVCNLLVGLGQQAAVVTSLIPALNWFIDPSICTLNDGVGNCPH